MTGTLSFQWDQSIETLSDTTCDMLADTILREFNESVRQLRPADPIPPQHDLPIDGNELLARAIERFGGAPELMAPFRLPALAPQPAGADGPMTYNDAIANIETPGLWESVGQLQWAMKDDRIISQNAATRLIRDLAQDGELPAIVQAFNVLKTSLRMRYGVLNRATDQEITQIVALGHDMAVVVGESSDMLEYVKNELQAVNLMQLLQSLST